MRFKFDQRKSKKLKADPKRKIGFIEVQEIWNHPHYVDFRSDDPEQFRAMLRRRERVRLSVFPELQFGKFFS